MSVLIVRKARVTIKDELKTVDSSKVTCSWSFVHSHFLCKNPMRMRWLFDCFFRFVNIFLCYLFQKQASKDHLTQGNLLKTTLFNKKQSNLEKEMYASISLYCQYFPPGTGSNVHKTYEKLRERSSKIKKVITKKTYTCNTTDWNVSRRRLFHLRNW